MGIKWFLDKRHFLDSEEVRKLLKTSKIQRKKGKQELDYIQMRSWFIILLGLYSGLRVQEMADLINRDFQVYGSYAFIHVRNGKGGKQRQVRVGKELIEYFEEFMGIKRYFQISTAEDAALICKRNSEKMSTRSLQLACKHCLKLAGLDSHYSIHCLRHTYATHLYVASGHNLRLVQRQLGHSSVRVTEIYANIIEEKAEEAIERLYQV